MQTTDERNVQNAPKDQVDYIHLLPTELWREIFQLAHPSDSTPLTPTTFFHGDLLPINWKSLRYRQRQRLQLRGICKMLETIALERLFRDVIFYSGRITRFRHSIESNKWNPGSFTHRITILFANVAFGDAATTQSAQLGKLYDLCPNLRSITTFIYFHAPFGPSLIDLGWIHNTKQAIIQLPFISTDCLVALADQNPELETLALIAEEPGSSKATLQTKVGFPRLKRLMIPEDSVFTHISAPKLEWLGFNLSKPSDPGLTKFLWTNCTTLTHLHLNCVEMTSKDANWVLYILSLCPRAHTLSLEGHFVSTYVVEPREPHPSLRHLILRCEGPYEPIDWLEMLGLTSERRPLLSFETITIRCFRRHRQNFISFEKDKATTLGIIEELCGTLASTLIFEEFF